MLMTRVRMVRKTGRNNSLYLVWCCMWCVVSSVVTIEVLSVVTDTQGGKGMWYVCPVHSRVMVCDRVVWNT